MPVSVDLKLGWWLSCAGLFVACASTDPSQPTDTATTEVVNTSGSSEQATTAEPSTNSPTTGGAASSSTTTADNPTDDNPTDTGDDPTTGAQGACGGVPEFTGVSNRAIDVNGVQRNYIVSVPAGYDSSQPYPLVFAWHGRGGDGALARLYFKIEEASQGAAVFVYPDGLPLADMQNQTGWDLLPGSEDFAFFDAMVAEVAAALCIDSTRVFSTGHSFGGYMSNQLACHRSEVIRAIAPVASGGPFGSCGGPVAAWIAHGTLDAVVPFAQGEESLDHWLSANACDASASPVEPAPCVEYDGCTAGMPVVWCAHNEPAFDGHGWPNWVAEAAWKFFANF